jgi:SPP1 family predicted phage head-tail adaptor
MNAGVYREQVTIEKNGYTEDDIGNQIPGWEIYYKGYAYMNNLSGKEYWEAAQAQAENTIIFTMRYHPKLGTMNTTGYRLKHRGKEYNISTIDNVQYKNETIKMRTTLKE